MKVKHVVVSEELDVSASSSLLAKYNPCEKTNLFLVDKKMIGFEHTVFDLAYKGLFEEIKEKVREKEDLIFLKDANERQLIHWAALGGYSQIVQYLLEAGTPVDPRDDIGMTPLILASSANKLGVVELLLKKGAQVNAQNNEGHSAIQYAASKGWRQVLQALIENGADVNIVDKRRATPLHRAASKGDSATVSMLLSLGKDLNVNAKDSCGNTPLHLACEENSAEVAGLLIHHGAEVDIKNKEEKTPLELCSLPLQKRLMTIIKEKNNSSQF